MPCVVTDSVTLESLRSWRTGVQGSVCRAPCAGVEKRTKAHLPSSFTWGDRAQHTHPLHPAPDTWPQGLLFGFSVSLPCVPYMCSPGSQFPCCVPLSLWWLPMNF
jgi:hypothetical protein